MCAFRTKATVRLCVGESCQGHLGVQETFTVVKFFLIPTFNYAAPCGFKKLGFVNNAVYSVLALEMSFVCVSLCVYVLLGFFCLLACLLCSILFVCFSLFLPSLSYLLSFTSPLQFHFPFLPAPPPPNIHSSSFFLFRKGQASYGTSSCNMMKHFSY